jgi:hypothetical protein
VIDSLFLREKLITFFHKKLFRDFLSFFDFFFYLNQKLQNSVAKLLIFMYFLDLILDEEKLKITAKK